MQSNYLFFEAGRAPLMSCCGARKNHRILQCSICFDRCHSLCLAVSAAGSARKRPHFDTTPYKSPAKCRVIIYFFEAGRAPRYVRMCEIQARSIIPIFGEKSKGFLKKFYFPCFFQRFKKRWYFPQTPWVGVREKVFFKKFRTAGSSSFEGSSHSSS